MDHSTLSLAGKRCATACLLPDPRKRYLALIKDAGKTQAQVFAHGGWHQLS